MDLKSLVQPSVSCRHGRGLTKQSRLGPELLSLSGVGASSPLAGLNSSGRPRLTRLHRPVKRFVAPPPTVSRTRWLRGFPKSVALGAHRRDQRSLLGFLP